MPSLCRRVTLCGSLIGLGSRQVVDDALILPCSRQHAEIFTLTPPRGRRRASAFDFMMSADGLDTLFDTGLSTRQVFRQNG